MSDLPTNSQLEHFIDQNLTYFYVLALASFFFKKLLSNKYLFSNVLSSLFHKSRQLIVAGAEWSGGRHFPNLQTALSTDYVWLCYAFVFCLICHFLLFCICSQSSKLGQRQINTICLVFLFQYFRGWKINKINILSTFL